MNRSNPADQATAAVRCTIWALAVLLASVSACSNGESGAATTFVSTTTPSPTSALPDSCDRVTAVFPVAGLADGLAADCAEWIGRSSGRAVLGSVGSASVWSRRTGHGTALIVGAGSGISASFARVLTREGHNVALAARTPANVQEFADEIGATTHACDATVPGEGFLDTSIDGIRVGDIETE